ncbi:MAG: radical SAM protein [Patescibacteria group bacterium]|nr:radical SAM protein [Patescibacteria group bacterium]
MGKIRNKIKDLKYWYIKETTPKILAFLGRNSNKKIARAYKWIEYFAGTKSQKYMMKTMGNAFSKNLPLSWLIRRVSLETNKKMRKRVADWISDSMTRCQDKRLIYLKKYGVAPPFTILISPTMRCNLKCEGCFASEYDTSTDMDPKLIERIIKEGKEIGINFYIFLGGEPLLYKSIWDILKRHPDVLFQIYTNGTLLNEKNAERIAEMGNVIPTLSIEGFEKETEERRGKKTFAKLENAMDLLRKKGVIFFFSATITRKNIKTITSNSFIKFMIKKGASVGWYFNYMPVGRKPNLNLMLTPAQRNYMRKKAIEIRDKYPLLVIDFFGDGPVVGGCLAGGRHYVHINNNGDVEPCIFCHFSTDNIKNKSLYKALNSNFFREIRMSQPFGRNEIRPCPLIDYPGVMARIAQKHGAKPSHKGAESLFGELLPDLKNYSKKVAKIYDPIWKKEYKWVKNWEKIWGGTFVRPEKQKSIEKISKKRQPMLED